MKTHPMHPAGWVVDAVRAAGWTVHDLLSFTRASTLLLVSRNGRAPVVLKAGFGSDHVLAQLDEDTRRAAYGFYWYREMTAAERGLSRADFQHETMLARSATGLDNVVPVLDHGDGDAFDWYTMPYYPQGNLAPVLRNAGTSQDRSAVMGVLTVLADVAGALHGLHQRGIVHRDVYQENVLLDAGRGVLTDLGAARYAGRARGPNRRGPEVHWPPEYAHAYDTAGPEADVFGLAVLVYRLVCGDLPRLHGTRRIDVLHAPFQNLGDLLAAALEPDPQSRPTAAELAQTLRETAQGSAATARS